MSTAPTLYLDFDGVLNPHKKHANGSWFWPELIANLNEATRDTGAEIVVSSAWRKGRSVDELRSLLHNRGVTAPVVDATPENPIGSRADEIVMHLVSSRRLYRPFAIIDDVDVRDLLCGSGPVVEHLTDHSVIEGRQVWTRGWVGLTPEEAKRVRELLITENDAQTGRGAA